MKNYRRNKTQTTRPQVQEETHQTHASLDKNTKRLSYDKTPSENSCKPY